MGVVLVSVLFFVVYELMKAALRRDDDGDGGGGDGAKEYLFVGVVGGLVLSVVCVLMEVIKM